MSRYITCAVKINGQNGRTEILDTAIDGGEGEPLIVASFFDHREAERFCNAANACLPIDDPAAAIEAAREALTSLLKTVECYSDLCVAYRTGRRPKEKTLNGLVAASDAVESAKSALSLLGKAAK